MALFDRSKKKEEKFVAPAASVKASEPVSEEMLLKESKDYLTSLHRLINTVATSAVNEAVNGSFTGSDGSIEYLRQHDGSISIRGEVALAPIREVNNANAFLLKYASPEVARSLEVNSHTLQKAIESAMASLGFLGNERTVAMLEFGLVPERRSYFDSKDGMFTLFFSGNYQRPRDIVLFKSVNELKDDLEAARNFLFTQYFDPIFRQVVNEIKTRHDNVYVNFLVTELNLMRADGSFIFEYPREYSRDNNFGDVTLDLIRGSFNEGRVDLTFSTSYILVDWAKRLSCTLEDFYEKMFARYLPGSKVEVNVIDDCVFEVTVKFK